MKIHMNIYFSCLCGFSSSVSTKYGIKNQYDPCLKNYVETYLNLPEVQKAIHAEPKRYMCTKDQPYNTQIYAS